MDKLVVLNIGEGDWELGFPATVQIWQSNSGLPSQITGFLAPKPAIPHHYTQWQSAYRSLPLPLRLEVPKEQVTQVSVTQSLQDCHVKAQILQQELNQWYTCDEFRRIREKLLQQLSPNDKIRLVIQTQNLQLQRLPWYLFFEQFLQDYPQAEIALSSPEYESAVKSHPTTVTKQARILAILGNSDGIDITKDRKLLEQLPGAKVNFLVQPQRKEINDQLWEQPWDILFFAGHSSSQMDSRTGRIFINQTDSLTVEELRYGLRKAISRGLKLAIFNSCDGLGLAQALSDLQIPQIIVMREPVPDLVAQEFLKYFLQAFSRGENFYLAVREARQRLQGLEDKFPFGTWLPVICQNPAEMPISWLEQKATPISEPVNDLSREEYRDRQILLNKVKNFWVKGVLEKSLYDKALIELGLEERLDAVSRPWDLAWETPEEGRQVLPAGTKVIQQFDLLGAGRTLLILGEPGSGKTTTLLELTRDLIARAEQDVNLPMPVVFNLSSWGEKRTIVDWLVQELNTKYQIPKKIGKDWVSKQQLLLMLDGLDEVSSSRRDSCVQAINRFSQERGQTEIVVCSRIQDYQAFSYRLQFQGAIFVQPLNDKQIRQYLNQMGAELAGVREVLPIDTGLQELAKSPLMLSIMAIAYRGMSATELIRKSLTENQTQRLFEIYIERMLERQRQHQPCSRRQTLKWLKWLALRMFLNAQSVFSLEQMQPNLLQHRCHLWMYRLGVGLTLGSAYGFLFGFIYRSIIALPISSVIALPPSPNSISSVIASPSFLFAEQYAWKTPVYSILIHHFLALSLSPILGVVIGVIGTLPAALMGQLDEIKPIESLQWSWRRTHWILLGVGLLLCLLSAGGLLSSGGGIGLGFVISIVTSLLFSFGWVDTNVQSKTVPNEGIWRSTAIASSLILLVDISVILEVWSFLNPFWLIGFMQGLGLGFSLGLVVILRSKPVIAGVAVIQHLILRTVLWVWGYTPRNYARFLRYAARCALIQQVGSGYIFLHRLLLEYLALEETP